MKEVGFVRNHEDNDSFHDLKYFLDSKNQHEDINAKVINYLEKGVYFCDWMCIIFDEDGTVIGPNVYRTDGEWIWPDYFLYYLKKYICSMIVEPKFIEYLNRLNFIFPSIDELKIKEDYNQYVNPVKISTKKKDIQKFKIKKTIK